MTVGRVELLATGGLALLVVAVALMGPANEAPVRQPIRHLVQLDTRPIVEGRAELERRQVPTRDQVEQLAPLVQDLCARTAREVEQAIGKRLVPQPAGTAERRLLRCGGITTVVTMVVDLTPGEARLVARISGVERVSEDEDRPWIHPPPPLGSAEQARAQMTAAKARAERSGSARLAPEFWASAERKEREALAAFGQRNYVRAQQLFSEATRTYEHAARAADPRFREALEAYDRAAREAREAKEAGKAREDAR